MSLTVIASVVVILGTGLSGFQKTGKNLYHSEYSIV